MSEDCIWCRKPATGWAKINDARFCHGDDDESPTCYEKAQRADSWKLGRDKDTQAAIADLLPANGCVGVRCRGCTSVSGSICAGRGICARRQRDAETVRAWLIRQGWEA